MTVPIPVILDCDPGTDDAVAILLALASPELSVLAITVAGGNVGLEHTLPNALALTALAGSAVPVHAGADRPLLGAFTSETACPWRKRPGRHRAAARAVRRRRGWRRTSSGDILRDASEPVTLIGIGPATNLALALTTEPALTARVAQIVLMSGAWGEGNVTPAAEFNAWSDPEALAILLACGRPVVFATLELTAQALTTPARIAAWRGLGNGRCLQAACDIQATVPPLAAVRRARHAAARSVRRRVADPPGAVHRARLFGADGPGAGAVPRPHRDRPLGPHRRSAQRDGAGDAGRRRVLRTCWARGSRFCPDRGTVAANPSETPEWTRTRCPSTPTPCWTGLRAWVECESPTYDAAAVNRMMDIASRDLVIAGARIERVAGRMGFGDCVRATFPHATPNEPGILVMGHLDTVHPIGTLAQAAVPARGQRGLGAGHPGHEGRQLPGAGGDPPARARRHRAPSCRSPCCSPATRRSAAPPPAT